MCGWFGLVRCECLDNIFVWLCLAFFFLSYLTSYLCCMTNKQVELATISSTGD